MLEQQFVQRADEMVGQFAVGGIHAQAVGQIPIREADEHGQHIAHAARCHLHRRIPQGLQVADQRIGITRVEGALDAIHKSGGHVRGIGADAVGGLIDDKGQLAGGFLLIKETAMLGDVGDHPRADGQHCTARAEVCLDLANVRHVCMHLPAFIGAHPGDLHLPALGAQYGERLFLEVAAIPLHGGLIHYHHQRRGGVRAHSLEDAGRLEQRA